MAADRLMQEQLQLNLLRDMVKERSELSYDISKIEVSQDKELIQLVQAACKADKLQRALDIVRMMNNVKSMEAAAKVAQFYHLPGLQEKIGIIREATEEKRREKERNERYGGYRMVARETPLPESPYGVASKASLAAARQDTDFAPRTAMSKRTARASVGAHLNAAAVPVPRYVSETPEPMSMPIQDDKDVSPPSPGPKRRRLNNGHAEEDGFKRPQPPSESIASEPVHKSGGELISEV
jgi:chromosome transmission fidelity protein 4